MYNFDPYSVFLLLMTASVLQGHASEQTAKQIYSEVNLNAVYFYSTTFWTGFLP